MPVGMAVGGDGSTVVQGRVEHRRGQLHGGDRPTQLSSPVHLNSHGDGQESGGATGVTAAASIYSRQRRESP